MVKLLAIKELRKLEGNKWKAAIYFENSEASNLLSMLTNDNEKILKDIEDEELTTVNIYDLLNKTIDNLIFVKNELNKPIILDGVAPLYQAESEASMPEGLYGQEETGRHLEPAGSDQKVNQCEAK